MKYKNIILPATILVASIVLGGFYYFTQVNKQASIERQQEHKAEQDKAQQESKTKQDKKEYIAKRKNECYTLYEKETEKWNNVKDFEYKEDRDTCVVKYASSEPAKTESECNKMIENIPTSFNQETKDRIFDRYSDCLENWFSKEF